MDDPSFLCVHPNQELYGSDRVFLQTLRALRKQWPAARITVLLPGDGPLMKEAKEIVSDVRIEDLFVLRRSRLKSLWRELPYLFSRLLKARRWMKQYDATYISTVVVLDFLLASRLVRDRTMIHVHELPTGLTRVIFSLLLWVSKAFLICISEQCRRSYFGMSLKPNRVIWNGTKSLPTSAANAGEKELNILLIGRFNAWKGQGLLIDAINLLTPEQRASVRVRLLGSTFEGQEHFLEDIRSRIQKNGLSDVIEIFPFEPDPSAHYAWAEVVAVPSIQPEPFGLVAIEAMSASRAVIAADHGGLSEIVVDNVTGLRVEPGNALAWRDAILHYLQDRHLVLAHGQAGRRRFVEHFDEAIYMSRITDVVSLVLDPKHSV